LRLRYKSFATCISVTFPYSASECAHSIKLHTHTRARTQCRPSHVSLFYFSLSSSLSLPQMETPPQRDEDEEKEKKKRFMLRPRYTESRRDRNNFISLDSSTGLPSLYRHRKFHKPNTSTTFSRNGNQSEMFLYTSLQANYTTNCAKVQKQDLTGCETVLHMIDLIRYAFSICF